MQIESYSVLMYKGGCESPIIFEFEGTDYRITLTGEGGNRHIILENSKGSIDLWVDTHCAPDRAFISSISVKEEPGARFMYWILKLLEKYAANISRHTQCYDFMKDGLDYMFNEIWMDMALDRISRF